MISAITPIAIPQARSAELDPKMIRRLTSGTFPVFQLDATAYPGNSGSPGLRPRDRRGPRHRQHGVRQGNEGNGADAAQRHHLRGSGEVPAGPAAEGPVMEARTRKSRGDPRAPLPDLIWLKALLKALVLPPTGPLLLAALGLGAAAAPSRGSGARLPSPACWCCCCCRCRWSPCCCCAGSIRHRRSISKAPSARRRS